MSSVNRVILIGRCGDDPSVRYMPNGDCVANLSIATSKKYRDSAGDKQEKTTWHKIVAFKSLGEIIGEHVKKGNLIYIEGELQNRTWEQDGIKRYATEIVAKKMEMLSSKKQD